MRITRKTRMRRHCFQLRRDTLYAGHECDVTMSVPQYMALCLPESPFNCNATVPLHNKASAMSQLSSELLVCRHTTLILSDNFRFLLPIPTPPRMWAVGHVGCVNIINETTGSVNGQLSDKATNFRIASRRSVL